MAAQPWFCLAVGVVIFATPRRLSGPLLYDDKAAVVRNPVVRGEVPTAHVWMLDFWGEEVCRSTLCRSRTARGMRVK